MFYFREIWNIKSVLPSLAKLLNQLDMSMCIIFISDFTENTIFSPLSGVAL